MGCVYFDAFGFLRLLSPFVFADSLAGFEKSLAVLIVIPPSEPLLFPLSARGISAS
jgi:hypothetical protein